MVAISITCRIGQDDERLSTYIACSSILTGARITVINVLVTIGTSPTSFTGTGVGCNIILIKDIILYI